MNRLIIGAGALVAAGAITVLVVLFGSGAPVGSTASPRQAAAESDADPAASGRGAQLLNPYCRNVPAPGFDRPPNTAHRGEFDDAPYGYAVAIPAGLLAYSSPAGPTPAGPTQGFFILLSADPRAFLSVDASYDVFYDITAEAVHRRDAGGVRLHDTLLADQAAPDALDGVAGGRYRMQFRCPGDQQTYIRDDLIVIRNREVYRLELQTIPARYGADVQLLSAMQRSWHWVAVHP